MNSNSQTKIAYKASLSDKIGNTRAKTALPVDDEPSHAIQSLDEILANKIPSLHGPKRVKSDDGDGK